MGKFLTDYLLREALLNYSSSSQSSACHSLYRGQGVNCSPNPETRPRELACRVEKMHGSARLRLGCRAMSCGGRPFRFTSSVSRRVLNPKGIRVIVPLQWTSMITGMSFWRLEVVGGEAPAVKRNWRGLLESKGRSRMPSCGTVLGTDRADPNLRGPDWNAKWRPQ
jgi:hypothetical protein